MTDANALIAAYAESHQNRTNKLIHWVCVPAIMWTTVGLLWAIPHDYFGVGPGTAWMNWGTIGVVLSLLFYFRMSLTVGVGMTIVGGETMPIEADVPLNGWSGSPEFYVQFEDRFVLMVPPSSKGARLIA